MMSPKRIVVSILEEQLNLITDEDERMVHKASRLVEDNIRDIRTATAGVDLDQRHITLLSALRISLDNILRIQQLHACQERLTHLNTALDEALR